MEPSMAIKKYIFIRVLDTSVQLLQSSITHIIKKEPLLLMKQDLCVDGFCAI